MKFQTPAISDGGQEAIFCGYYTEAWCPARSGAGMGSPGADGLFPVLMELAEMQSKGDLYCRFPFGDELPLSRQDNFWEQEEPDMLRHEL